MNIDKKIDNLRFWETLRYYYFKFCTNETNTEWAESAVNMFKNEVRLLIHEREKEILQKAVEESQSYNDPQRLDDFSMAIEIDKLRTILDIKEEDV